MTAPIILYGSSGLRKLSADLTVDDDLFQLSADLFEILKKAKGVGLAAPQIGILKKAFIIDTSSCFEDDQQIPLCEQFFANPEVLWYSPQKTYYNEGCLSIPGIYEDVLRPEKIVVRYFDQHLNPKEDEFDGLTARIFQHEYDHLQGVLFVDRLNTLKRKLLSGKLNKIKNS